MKHPDLIKRAMIAPCGMNCAICVGHLREKNVCPGCNGADDLKVPHCALCRIKNCEQLASGRSKFCFRCDRFPCLRLKQLDKRYRTRYGMSMIENLETIRASGIRAFVEAERRRWTCPECGGIVCVHRRECLYCGRERAMP